MKYAITGHTSGIGEELYHHFRGMGFSRSTGFDITDVSGRNAILDECQNYDVFINCAHSEFAQTYLLEEWYNRYKNTNKMIVNIGSLKMIHLQMDNTEVPNNIAYENSALLNLFDQLCIQSSRCKIGLLELGPVATKPYKSTGIQLCQVSDIINNMVEYLSTNSRCHMKIIPEK